MADTHEADNPPRQAPMEALKGHWQDNKKEMCTYFSRLLTIVFAIGYVFPLFGTSSSSFNKVLLANGLTNALRLSQRVDRFSFSREFLTSVMVEDSFHYIAYTLIFLYMQPSIFIIIPVTVFALLHFASYTLKLLDLIGQNSCWAVRLIISFVELYSRNLLRIISLTEIMLMPMIIVGVFTGRASLMSPLMYYQFICLRYSSRRNAYTRNMFYELRVFATNLALSPKCPAPIGSLIKTLIGFITKLAPPIVQQEPTRQE